MIDWKDSIVSDIAKRRCVLFLGSGVSANCVNDAGERPKTWTAVLNEGLSRLGADISKKQKESIKKAIRRNDLLMACELIRTHLGQDEYKDFIKSEFYDKHFHHAEIHAEIEQLDSRFVVTPNFDNIYEQYVHTIPNNDVVVAKYCDDNIADLLRTARRLIIKSHGDITHGDKIIFTKSDYANARSTYSQFYAILDALLLTHTFIFIGAGFSDPDIQLLLEDYTYRNKFKRNHFFITTKDSMSKEEFDIVSKTMSLKFITYDKKENHKELTDSIKELHRLVEMKRDEISASKDW